jgi:integrase
MSSGMKVSEFMLNLQKRFIDERKVSESTANQYLQTLWCLNGKKSFNNLAWTKKYDDVMNIINEYAKSTQLTNLAVLTAALSLFSTKPTYKSVHSYWRDKMMEYKKEFNDNTDPHEKTEKQEENWISWEEVSKKKSGLKEVISSFSSTKNITAQQYDKLLQYLIISLYTDIAPRRNQDYLDMYVVKKAGKDMENNRNYYDLSTHKFIFNKYKTAKKYGQQTIDVPPELQSVIATYLKFNPLSKTKQKEYKFLVKADGSNLNSVNSITRVLNKIFGKKVGSSMLRHIYISSKYGDNIKELQEVAKEMGHSTDEQQGTYYKN